MSHITLDDALRLYLKRQARELHPDGSYDTAGYWWPSESEHCDCCDTAGKPSKYSRYPQMIHCRTITHVANLCEVDAKRLKRLVLKAQAKL